MDGSLLFYVNVAVSSFSGDFTRNASVSTKIATFLQKAKWWTFALLYCISPPPLNPGLITFSWHWKKGKKQNQTRKKTSHIRTSFRGLLLVSSTPLPALTVNKCSVKCYPLWESPKLSSLCVPPTVPILCPWVVSTCLGVISLSPKCWCQYTSPQSDHKFPDRDTHHHNPRVRFKFKQMHRFGKEVGKTRKEKFFLRSSRIFPKLVTFEVSHALFKWFGRAKAKNKELNLTGQITIFISFMLKASWS